MGCITDDDINEKILSKFRDKVVIKVKNTVQAIQELAKYKRDLYNIPIIGITGSVRENKHKRYNCQCNVSKI